jgi:hypothetical protein
MRFAPGSRAERKLRPGTDLNDAGQKSAYRRSPLTSSTGRITKLYSSGYVTAVCFEQDVTACAL